MANKDNMKFVRHLKKGDYFGELCLVCIQRSIKSYASEVFTITETFSNKNFKLFQALYPGVNARIQKGLDQYKPNYEKVVVDYMQKS